MRGALTADQDLVLLVVRRWRAILIFAALGLGAGAAYALLATEYFSARLTVVPSTPSRDQAALALASKLPGLDMTSADSKRIEAVLTSASVSDEVIEKFKLRERYGSTHLELVRAALWKHCSTSVDRKSGVVALVCEDTSPEMARDITAYFGEVGNRVFRRISASSASEEARFLDVQVANARRDVDEASRALREFQELHKIVDLPEQSKAVISAMASLKGELLSKQLELSYVSTFSARTEANVIQLQQQISILSSKLRQLEASQQGNAAAAGSGSGSAGAGATGSGSEFFPGAMAVPQLRFQLELLLRDQKIKETVFGLLTQRYEVAKVDAARDTSTFQILDQPTLPTLRSRPVRRKIAMLGLFGGLAAGGLWILGPVWWRRRRVSSDV